MALKPNFWIFISISADYENGISHFYVKDFGQNEEAKFVIPIQFGILQIKNNYKFSFAGFSPESSKTNGLIGSLMYWFVGLFHVENGNLLWITTNFDKDLMKHHHINTDFVFDTYRRDYDVKSSSSSSSSLKAKFINKVAYKFKQGLQVYPKSGLKVVGNMQVKKNFVTSLSIFMGFDFRKIVRSKKVILFRRGPPNVKKSGYLEVFGERQTLSSKWKLRVKYFYKKTKNGKKHHMRILTSGLYFSGAFSSIQVSLVSGPHGVLKVGMYLDGMVEFFLDKSNTIFDFNAFNWSNHILDPKHGDWDYSTIFTFIFLESAGNLIFPLLSWRANVS